MIDFDRYDVISFDCYGTLIDWERGIVSGLRPVLRNHGVEATDEEILNLHAQIEHELQSGSTKGHYVKYRSVLEQEVREAGKRWGFEPEPFEVRSLADSLRRWRPFPDTVEALEMLKERYKLAIISNVDDGLFALTACHLEVEFDWIVTAEQAGTYKPSTNNFEVAIERMGVERGRLVHAAESLFHDVAPAGSLGISTVWVHRRAGKGGFGATPPSDARPDLEVPDLKTLASMACS
ncbi:MAG: haloacid dehalogenase type II [Actinomycetota bacterium]|nr:haloacid dehalogenase type II [Actinomycetota bacterium]